MDASAGMASPLGVAISAGDRETIAMVKEAVRTKRLRLAYQPVVLSRDPGRVAFHEGLIRVQEPNGRIIPAKDFIDAVEGIELGREIDCAALDFGLMTLAKHRDLRISINMSARSIGYRPWIEMLRRAIVDNPRLGSNLILEINEASALQVPDVLKPFMTEMRKLGIVFALDDFGAGMTSVRLLQEMGFEIAKIDGSLVKNVDRLPQIQAAARAAIAMAQELGMYIVAEAVETEGEAQWLREAGVGCLQGYLFGPPTVTPDFRAFRHGRPALKGLDLS
jgi:EAL domain-containing protein (putative c-di-GMP-specific phosphodiesterase class I)